MGERTLISWCHHTFNLWIGCWKIDPECANCYAAATDHQRWGGEHWGRTEPRKWTGDAYWKQLARWNRKAKKAKTRKRVFVGSLMDWAETHPVAEVQGEMNRRRARFWDIARACDWLDFLMLTKRIEDAPQYLPWYATPVADGEIATPWPNIWLGTTAGTVPTLREHAHALRRINAAVHFISAEPLLDNIPREEWDKALAPSLASAERVWKVDWLIAGNESGRKRREVELDAVRTARDAALAWGVAFHFKQWVDSDGKTHLPVLDGRRHDAFPEATCRSS